MNPGAAQSWGPVFAPLWEPPCGCVPGAAARRPSACSWLFWALCSWTSAEPPAGCSGAVAPGTLLTGWTGVRGEPSARDLSEWVSTGKPVGGAKMVFS